MVEIGRFDDDSTRIGNTQKTTPAVNENSGISKQELGEKIRTAFKTGKKAEISEDVLNTLNKIRLKVPPKNADIYANRVAKEETSITNLIERGKEPLKRPNENPTFVMDNGPHGGKLEQFPQRANGTYRTIETLPNGGTYECTYSQNGILLNEIKRESKYFSNTGRNYCCRKNSSRKFPCSRTSNTARCNRKTLNRIYDKIIKLKKD